MIKKSAFSVLVICLALITMNFSCNKDQETQAAKLADSLAHSITAVHNAIDVAYSDKLISDTDYKVILNDLLTADQAGLNINAAISGIANGTSTTSQLNAAISSMENALTDGTLHIKNPDTLVKVNAAVAAINTTLTSIESLYLSK